jgi:Rod binding domain-containing protein
MLTASAYRTPYPTASATPPAGVPQALHDRARKTAQEFEAVFLGRMFESMFSGVGEDGPMGGGASAAPFRAMLTDEYARSVSASGGIGLADHVYREILALQEAGR